ncbi:3-oxo-tetronate kinase [Mycobacterium sp. 236(2023)]|uniref:3-oxo-tetronate kinase n=1 Tax=Mycobacterium sp. 236(2023) TaxID=3038163 RepID=UPI0024158474|nr:3-oxo-tetronate kinase [Mycobacterium sp. 236(2023)]MDG4662981.1 four-carbon acid sugar kinase family protein [Mycobacterium sp. 236(2023)]
MSAPKIGCIADDYTGGTDVAAALRRQGLRTVLLFGPPADGLRLDECEAVVVALKTRALEPEAAVKMSMAARHWLIETVGVPTVYFKYCSTFDSTPAGNIGPVADALIDAAGGGTAVVCPATPEHGRTLYQGHLFVADKLLSESPMRHHPLTPMTDSDVVRLMSAQTPHSVGSVAWQQVQQGPVAVASILAASPRYVVIDAVDDSDLDIIARAVEGAAVVTGGAGLAGALGRVLVEHDRGHMDPRAVTAPDAPTVVFAGSCSRATLGQVDYARAEFASYRLDPRDVDSPGQLLEPARTWLLDSLGDLPVMIYSSAPAEERGPADPVVAEQLEATIGALAKAAVAAGARRVVVAGGETSGAVVDALGIRSVVVDAEADRGVPWCSTPDHSVSLLLKSGNFGRPDLLVRAATSEVLA